MEKYELLTLGSYPRELVSWYEDNYYDPEAPDWYGLCTSFSRASSYENIEIFPSSEDNIVFRVGDKKGLLSLAHENDITEDVDGSDPVVFHYWLLNYIKDQGKAFVADLDPGQEVWSYPIYGYDMESEINGNRESIAVTVYYADDFVTPDYIGTKERESTYTYDLLLDGEGAIIGGEWTGQSINNHPDRLHFAIEAGTNCPYLDYEEVLRIAESRDDSLELPGESVDIAPGTYNLILLDEDVYNIGYVSGDIVSIYVEKQEGSHEDIMVDITDGEVEILSSTVVDLENPMSFTATVEHPPCIITLSQNDYSDPNIYTLQVDQVKTFNQKIPYVPKNGKWSGFALTNPGEIDVKRVTLTTYTQEGQPLQTILGPLNIFPGEKRLFIFDDLPWRQRELSDINKLALMSDGDINFLNLFGYAQDSLACFVQGNARGNRFIIPDTVPNMSFGRTMFGAIENESFEESIFSMSLYSMDGDLVRDERLILGPKESLFFRAGSYPFYNMPDSGWIEITGEQDVVLNGYEYTSSGNMTETIFGLPVNSLKKIVPHIPPPGYWITTVTVINPNDQENRLDFHLKLAGEENSDDISIIMAPHEKRSLELQDQFGKNEGDPLFHSILEINGEYPVAGCYTFTAPMEEASFPLLDEQDFKEELVLPHYPGNDGYWWTGVGIFNPSSFPMEVIIEPCNENGDVMDDIAARLYLEAGAYEVFEIGSFFSESASDISFVKFRVEEAQGLIGGFYLYGNNTIEMLSGANM